MPALQTSAQYVQSHARFQFQVSLASWHKTASTQKQIKLLYALVQIKMFKILRTIYM